MYQEEAQGLKIATSTTLTAIVQIPSSNCLSSGTS